MIWKYRERWERLVVQLSALCDVWKSKKREKPKSISFLQTQLHQRANIVVQLKLTCHKLWHNQSYPVCEVETSVVVLWQCHGGLCVNLFDCLCVCFFVCLVVGVFVAFLFFVFVCLFVCLFVSGRVLLRSQRRNRDTIREISYIMILWT